MIACTIWSASLNRLTLLCILTETVSLYIPPYIDQLIQSLRIQTVLIATYSD